MQNQLSLIRTNIWDVLIILDAWRYDYRVYLGNLPVDSNTWSFPVNTEASCTAEWLSKTWKDHYDITYISGNPYVNNVKKPMDKFYPFVAIDHFNEIIDVWTETDDRGRTRPEAVTKAALNNLDHNPQMVVHYLQPHAPYMFSLYDELKNKTLLEYAIQYTPNKLLHTIQRLVPYEKRKNLTPEMMYSKKFTVEQIRTAYLQNIYSTRYALRDLVRHLYNNGYTFVITSDHGEYLGEGGKFGHGGEHTDLITTVPWVEV